MMSRLQSLLEQQPVPSALAPLFWQHGEDEAVLRNEIRQMHENGIGSFIVESRPHPDFLGEQWWYDLDSIIDEARSRQMQVWVFDDSSYPSGFAGGVVRDQHPEHLKVYLAQRHIDAYGPLTGSSFLVQPWLRPADVLVGVIAARRVDGRDLLDEDSLQDLTELVVDGVLYWDVPEGEWRLFVLVQTREGGEEWTRDYINPIDAEAVNAFIQAVYEAHFQHYSAEFGKTFAGFFTDEPRLGSASTYEATLGKKFMEMASGGPMGNYEMVLPYSRTLLGQLDMAWKGSIRRYLPLLWYPGGKSTTRVRYTYMNLVSQLFGEHYTQQIGDWCRQHGVKLIGHVVEDNGAHARLGYGTGHFFRALKGMDYSGVDVVYQVWPELTSGRFTTPFGYLHADFFYWGLVKMASSAGHIDPKKQGITVCEAFGAYGWQEGLKLMKWLTDHICVRGVNLVIPHAFSPRFPDPDCPPHFYAQGANPQWRYFHHWSSYANRLCYLLSGGKHVAPAAVIYHAEAEWSGDYQPFELVVKALAQAQIDCDVVPIDTIVHKEALQLHQGSLEINGESHQVVVVPYAERLPADFLASLLELAEHAIPVIFVNAYPVGLSDQESNEGSTALERVRIADGIETCALEELVPRLGGLNVGEVICEGCEDALRVYHYQREREDLYFFTNESKRRAIDTTLKLKTGGTPRVYNALTNTLFSITSSYDGTYTSLTLHLEPFESLFLVFSDELQGTYPSYEQEIGAFRSEHSVELIGGWTVSCAEALDYPSFTPVPVLQGPGNAALPGLLPTYAGTLRYETSFELDEPADRLWLQLGEVYELAEVWINDQQVGTRICPPYAFDITRHVQHGKNTLRVDVTNTLAKQYPNEFDRAMPQEPSGLVGPVRIVY